MDTVKDYLHTLVGSKELVVVYVKLDDVAIEHDLDEKGEYFPVTKRKTNEKKYIGKIKHSLDNGIVLEKSTHFNEIFINGDAIIAVRKWTSRDSS